MSDSWRVKLNYLPSQISAGRLEQEFGVPRDRIYVDARQTGSTWFGWISGFPSEKSADYFAQRNDRKKFSGATVRCKAFPPISSRSGVDSSSATTGGEVLAQPCSSAWKCYKAECRYDHPTGWEACRDGLECNAYFCKANHPPGRQKSCPQGLSCKRKTCYFLHPEQDEEPCSEGIRCRIWDCTKWHSKNRVQKCPDGALCSKYLCTAIHPSERNPCPTEETCQDLSCQRLHPLSRPKECEAKENCGYSYCHLLHPQGWDPCPDGTRCELDACPHRSHPGSGSIDGNSSSSCCLKTREQRDIEREKADLPILKIRDKFCEELERKRVLVIKAETGSGKSTQLPQYAAEYFGGTVICTQPRVIAAVSLARRVAQEYDGCSVGESVGYRVGVTSAITGHNRVPGRDIIYMTDGAFIQESMNEYRLGKVRVLIIDEAHERSLNTDIVMGIAKLLLNKRDDFYVVVSSATIDPKTFLEFFDQENHQALDVEGKMFPVVVEYRPAAKENIEKTVVETLQKLYPENEGTTLVFLPGQREIEQALAIFSMKLPENCVALSLYSTLSADDQERVLKFDKGENGERRMVVFTTNIAETSLTIEDTRLIIDSGLAREPQYNFQTRLTTMETRLISKASADQRRGRAGRTAKGYCVRLYRWEDLTRDNIEPAFVHSPIDLTVLQLIHLEYDPLTFPFIDPPEDNVLNDSLSLLERLDCIDQDNKLTRRGELFVLLNFDPRYSAFLVDCYLEHKSILDLVTIIVAILTAPGPFFLLGGTDEDRREATRSIGTSAKSFQSDLLFYASLYREWRKTGQVENDVEQCPICKAKTISNNICRSCRVSFGAMRRLNTKILNLVENVCKTAMKTIETSRWNLDPSLTTEKTESEIIGENLLKYFPEHVGELVSTDVVTKGGRFISTGISLKVNKTSCYYQEKPISSKFISMSINQISPEFCLVDRLHPIV